MQNIELLRLQLNHLITQARHDIYTLSRINDSPNKQQVLQRLWDTISSIHFLSEFLANQASMTSSPPIQQQVPVHTNQRTFTVEELVKYDGKDGRPAYVAVNGTVYDVTNNRAWAAATHFGLVAGKDYTQEFASCHTGQQSILATLPVVGRLT